MNDQDYNNPSFEQMERSIQFQANKSETWIIKAAVRNKIDFLEVWYWNSMLPIARTGRRTSIFEELNIGDHHKLLPTTHSVTYFGRMCRKNFNNIEVFGHWNS